MKKILAWSLTLFVCVSAHAWAPPTPNYTPPSLLNSATTLCGFGDSITGINSSYQVPGSQANLTGAYRDASGGKSYGTWAEIYNPYLTWDLTQGYGGQYAGLLKVIVAAGGTNYAGGDTVAIGGPGITNATATLTVSGGQITGVTVTNPGSGATGLITATITTSTGSGAILEPVQGGSGTFGNSGEFSTTMVYRTQDIVASNCKIVVVQAGTNDVVNSGSSTSIEAALQTIVERFNAAGRKVILVMILPRNSLTSAQEVTRNRVNAWIAEYVARSNTLYNTAQPPNVTYADATGYWTDGSSAAGAPVGGAGGTSGAVTTDGTHPSQLGAQYLGYVIANAAQRWTGPPPAYAPRSWSQQNSYNASTNPGGYLSASSINPYFLGTSGTITAPVTGTAATGWTCSRVSGSATGTATCSVESPWSDGHAGQRQVYTFSFNSGGSATEQYQLASANVAYTSWGLVSGDLGTAYLVAKCEVEVSNLLNMTQLYVNLTDSVSSPAWSQQMGADQSGVGAHLASSAQIPFAATTRWYLQTVPMLYPTTGANLKVQVVFGFDTSTAAASGTIKVNTCGVYKSLLPSP